MLSTVMAAKVLMVSVPAVLGLASVRVYRVSEVTKEEMVSPQQLSIYTPLPFPQELHFIEEQPGALQKRLTAVRETIQGAFGSVKVEAGNLSIVGLDVYHYLKDPPSGFLPRLASVTLTGLVGMMLTRRGSRVKKLVVPLALMTAATSICYPAQTVALLKVSMRKLNATSLWSSSLVTSVFSPGPACSGQSGPASPDRTGHPITGQAYSTLLSEKPPRPPTEHQQCTSVQVTDIAQEEEGSSSYSAPEEESVPAHDPTPEEESVLTHDPTPEEEESVPAHDSTPEESVPVPAGFEEFLVGGSVPAKSPSDNPLHTGKSSFSPDHKLLDYGQSNPADADLYSTR